MGKVRSATVAAIVASLIATGGTPALADDVTPLAVMATGLTDGQIIGPMTRFHPTWTEGAAVTKIEVYRDAKLAFTTTNPAAELRVSLSGTTNGSEVLVTVRVYETPDTWAEAGTRVVVDTEAPSARFSPTSGRLPPVRGILTLTARDVSADTATISLIAGSDPVATVDSAPWTITYDTVGSPLYLRIQMIDKVGNLRVYSGFEVDNVPPVIGDLEAEDGPQGRVRGQTQLHLVFDDPVNYYEAKVDGNLAGRWDGGQGDNFYGTVRDDYINYDYGNRARTATVEVLARDVAGNESRKSFSLVVDVAGPTITSATPADGTLVRGRWVTGTIRATDPAGISSVDLDHYSPATTNGRTVTAATGADGRQTLTWSVYDRLGNLSTAKRYIIVDNTRPTLKITKAPKNGARVKGTVKVSASAADRNGISRVEVLVNGKVVARDVKAGYKFTINTKKYGKKFRIRLRAYDRAGNVTTTSTRTWRR